VEGVPPVPARTRPAPRSMTAPAGDEKHVVGFALGAVDGPNLTRLPFDLLDLAPQPDRTAAVAGMDDLLLPALEVVPGPLPWLPGGSRIRTVAQGPEVEQVVGTRITGGHARQAPLQTAQAPVPGSHLQARAAERGRPARRTPRRVRTPPVPAQRAISPKATLRWKSQMPLRSHDRRVHPGQPHAGEPVISRTCCKWVEQMCPYWTGKPQGFR